jgi:hypothetical protein
VTSAGEQTLDLPKLYTSARRFHSPPPSLVPPRPQEMERGGEIAADTRCHLALALGNSSWERVRERGPGLCGLQGGGRGSARGRGRKDDGSRAPQGAWGTPSPGATWAVAGLLRWAFLPPSPACLALSHVCASAFNSRRCHLGILARRPDRWISISRSHNFIKSKIGVQLCHISVDAESAPRAKHTVSRTKLA